MLVKSARDLLRLGPVVSALLILGCGDDEPKRISCDPGYVAVRVESDDDEFVCTKAPQTACPNGYVALETGNAQFVCMQPSTIVCNVDGGTSLFAVQQANGTYACMPVNQIQCASGQVPVAQTNGTYVCSQIDQIACQTGFVPTQKPDGSYACIASAGDVVLGTLSCPAGFTPNLQGTACISLNQITCGEGYLPQKNAKSGAWECVDALAAQKVQRTVHGTFTDCVTKLPIPGVSVTVEGIVVTAAAADGGTTTTTTTQAQVKTDDNGYFNVTGAIVGGSIVWAATMISADKTTVYKLKTGTIDVATLDAANGTLQAVNQCLEPTPVQDLVIAGQVFAGTNAAGTGTAPAAGATVQLFDDATSGLNLQLVETVKTDLNGKFAFKAVADSKYRVVVAPFDADKDTIADYQKFEWNCNGSTLFLCPQNYGLLQIILQRYADEGRVAYTNLLNADGTPVANMPQSFKTFFDATVGSYILPGPGSNIVFQTNLPMDKASLNVELYEVRATTTGATNSEQTVRQLAVTPTFDATLTTLTLDPSDPLDPTKLLVADEDPTLLYELRFRNFVWATGQFIVAPGETQSIYFDVKGTTPPLAAPAVTLYYKDDTGFTLGTSAKVDANGIRIFNASGRLLGTLPFTQVWLQWLQVPTAASYTVYGRVADTSGSFDRQPWTEVGSVPAFDAHTDATSRWASVDISDLLPTTALEYGRKAQLAVVPVTVDGVESPVDPSKSLIVQDQLFLGASAVTDFTVGTATGVESSASTLSFGLGFTENVSTGVVPVLAGWSGSGTVVARSELVDWGSGLYQNSASVGLKLRDNRYDACSLITVAGAPGDTELTVTDASLFAANDQVVVYQAGTGPMADSTVLTVASVISNAQWQRLQLAAALGTGRTVGTADDAVPVDAWVCKPTLAVSSAALTANAADFTTVTLTGTSPVVAGSTVDVVDMATGTVYQLPVMGLNSMAPSIMVAGDRTAITAGSLVLRLPPASGSVWATKVSPYATTAVVSGIATSLPLNAAGNDLQRSRAIVSDKVLVDKDGDILTVGDQVVGTITAVGSIPDSTTTVQNDRSQAIDLSGLGTLDSITVDSLMIVLGPASFQITNFATLTDTGGLAATSTLNDQLAICGGAISDNAAEPNAVCAANSGFLF